MFTVIFLSDSAKTIYDRVKDYFMPFVEDGKIAFCDWNQSVHARTMREAIPELPGIIQGKSNWRAVVVDHPRAAACEPSEVRDHENPFDYVDNTQLSLNLDDSEHALIRLSHILLGYPQLSAKAFKPYIQYEDADTGKTVQGEPLELLRGLVDHVSVEAPFEFDGAGTSEDDLFGMATARIGQVHNNVRRLFKEVEYTEDERAKHQELVDRYRMKEVRPSEVAFVSTRSSIEEDEKGFLQRAWNSNDEQNSSRFVERNDYPPMSRFAVYELLEAENSGYDQDLLRFWLGVLTLAINRMPPGGFQADRVYRLGVKFGTAELGEMLNSHISQLAMVRDHLDHLIATPERPPKIEVADLLSAAETGVAFDDLGGEELVADQSDYGLASDRPRDEHKRWSAEILGISSAAALFMRKPRRMVARAVMGAREQVRISSGEVVVLDEFKREDLKDQLARRLRSLVVPTTANLLDQQRLQRTIDAGDREVRGYLNQRMNSVTIMVAAFIGLGIWAAAFLPYLLQAARRSAITLLDASMVLLVVLAVVACGGLLVLFFLRRGLLARIGRFNDGVTDEVASVKQGASRFAAFLASYVTYRKGSDVLSTLR